MKKIFLLFLITATCEQQCFGNPLHDFILNNDFTGLKKFLYIVSTTGKLVNLINEKNDLGLTPLHLAIDANNTDMINILLRYGSATDIASLYSFTLFEVGKHRLLYGAADIEGYYTPLQLAFYRDPFHSNTNITELLLSEGAFIDRDYTCYHNFNSYCTVYMALQHLQKITDTKTIYDLSGYHYRKPMFLKRALSFIASKKDLRTFYNESISKKELSSLGIYGSTYEQFSNNLYTFVSPLRLFLMLKNGILPRNDEAIKTLQKAHEFDHNEIMTIIPSPVTITTSSFCDFDLNLEYL